EPYELRSTAQIAAVVTDHDLLFLNQFHAGFEVGGGLEDGKSNCVIRQRLQGQLGLAFACLCRDAIAVGRKLAQLAEEITGKVVADVDQPGEQFRTLTTENIREQKNQFARKHW